MTAIELREKADALRREADAQDTAERAAAQAAARAARVYSLVDNTEDHMHRHGAWCPLFHDDIGSVSIRYSQPDNDSGGMTYFYSRSQRQIIGRTGGGTYILGADCPWLSTAYRAAMDSWDRKRTTPQAVNELLATFFASLAR